jgi:hypothetical protein
LIEAIQVIDTISDRDSEGEGPLLRGRLFGFTAAITFVVIALATAIGVSKADAGVVLVTAEEASLPPPKQLGSFRGITRGPRIDVSDFEDGKLQSPLHFRIKFRAFGGSTIDVNSVAVTYLRGPNIDITARIKLFVQPTGIDIPDAVVPPGEHAFRIELKDADGRPAVANFRLSIAPN